MDPVEIAEYLIVGSWFLSHVVAAVGTPAWFPAWLVKLINGLAANYGKARNK